MKKNFLALYIVSQTCSQAFALANSGLHLSADTLSANPSILIVENWKYHLGDDIKWAARDYDDSEWQVSDTRLTPDDLKKMKWPGIGWFRFHVTLDSALVNKPLGLRIMQAGACETYIDGALVYTFGGFHSEEKAERPNRPGFPKVISFGDAAPHVIAIRYSNLAVKKFQRADFNAGFYLRMGDINIMTERRSYELETLTAYQMFFTSLALAVGLLHLVLFIFSLEIKANLYFALFLFSYAAAIFFDYQNSIPEDIGQQLFYMRVHRAVMIPFILFELRFAYSLFFANLPKQFWAFFAIGVCLGVLAIYQPGEMFKLFAVFMFIVFAEIGRLIVSMLRKKRQEILLIGMAFFMLFIFMSFDALIDMGFPVPFRDMQNPYSFGTIGFFLAMSVYLSRNFAKTHKLEAENIRKSKELEDARTFQLSLLPQQIDIPGLDACFYMQTATEVGGDYYDYRLADDGSIIIAVGDATGHGMKAGTMVSIIKSLFVATSNQMEIVPFFEKCSETIRAMHLGNLYMAMMMLRLKDGQMTVSSAGMPPILIYHKKTGAIDELVIKGMPLGGSANFSYQKAEINLAPGDTVLLMSDGLPELFNDKNEMLDYSRIKEMFKQKASSSASEIIEHLKKASQHWMSGRYQEDDITLVCFKFSPHEHW